MFQVDKINKKINKGIDESEAINEFQIYHQF